MRFSILFVILISALTIQAQPKLKVACIGNSITEGTGLEDGKRYPQQLQQLAGDRYEVRNFGLDGTSILKKGDVSYWQEGKYKEALSWNPDIIVIEFGTHDSKPQNWIYSEDFEPEYTAFIKSFKSLSGNHKIYICLPTPVYKDDTEASDLVINDEIIPMIKKISSAQRVLLLDLYAALSGKPEFFPDGIHPNADGAKLIAEEVYKNIR
jgi:acyl-CoA thioesterase-1